MIDDYPKMIVYKTMRAKKTHICCECQREIKKGIQYKNISGLWSGKWEKYRVCIPCDELRDKLACDDGIPAFGEVGEWAREAEIHFPPGRSTADFVERIQKTKGRGEQ